MLHGIAKLGTASVMPEVRLEITIKVILTPTTCTYPSLAKGVSSNQQFY
jgi:hypothetical protein